MQAGPFPQGGLLPPGACVRDITRKLPGLIRPSVYYPPLILQADSEELESRSLRAMKKDFRALGWLVKGLGAQIVFSSALPALGTDEWVNKKIGRINTWLQNWCYEQGFGFSDHTLICRTPGLLAKNGKTLSQKGKRLLGQELARLMDRALN